VVALGQSLALLKGRSPKQPENQERKTLTLDELRRIVEDNAKAPPAAP
jgi:hypothetical protein